MRHLVLTQKPEALSVPKVVGELGPGDSIGIGLAGLLSGVQKYFSLDVVKHTNIERNLAIFQELVTLFQSKASIPDAQEFPNLVPLLDNYDFPSHILTEEQLGLSLSQERLELIKKSIIDNERTDSVISYSAPWDDASLIASNTADLIFSQYVLEHVNDLEKAYSAMYSWLKPGGMISNVVDFQCHGTATEWNGHWRYSRLMWKLIVGGRPFLLNREPAQTHINLLSKYNFNVKKIERYLEVSSFGLGEVAEQFKGMSEEDIKTLKIYTQATK